MWAILAAYGNDVEKKKKEGLLVRYLFCFVFEMCDLVMMLLSYFRVFPVVLPCAKQSLYVELQSVCNVSQFQIILGWSNELVIKYSCGEM